MSGGTYRGTLHGMRDLADLPKAHLHLHLEGSMRPATLAEWCRRDGVDLPPLGRYDDFGEFIVAYRTASDAVTSWDDLARLIDEVVEDAADDGCRWIEPAFYPANHVDRLGPAEGIWERAIEFGRASAARHGIGVGWIAPLNRGRPDEAGAAADLALGLAADGAPIVALGLHGDETAHPAEVFVPWFERAAALGLLAVPHAGELAGPRSVADAIDLLGADRVQHGVRAVEDPALVARLAAAPVTLDVCPSSNAVLGVYPLDEHPLVRLRAAGISCSLNADDPLLFGPGILAEYELVRDRMGVDDDGLADLARASITGSAAPPDVRADALAGIDAWLAT